MSASSGSASTVTRIFQGLRFCSDTVRKGEVDSISQVRELVLACLPMFFVDDVEDRLGADLHFVCAKLLLLLFSSLRDVARGSGELDSWYLMEATDGDRNMVIIEAGAMGDSSWYVRCLLSHNGASTNNIIGDQLQGDNEHNDTVCECYS